jgi:transcriptional regulator with XRE-family HTH domain
MGYRDVTQADLVRKTGISQPTISRILKGEKVADLTQIQLICTAIGVSWVDLLDQAQRSVTERVSPVTQLRPRTSEDTPTVAEPIAARKNKGQLKDDASGDDA